jgi:hypothetical protein
MRVGLIAPQGGGCQINPGSHMITAGIRHLVRLAVPDAVFVPVEMLHDDPQEWIAAGTCDALILCGNPRFSLSPADSFWECGIWRRLAAAVAAGIRVVDGWAGAAYGDDPAATLDDMASAILTFPRNAEFLALAKLATGRITRDRLMQRVYELAGAPSVLLPCSSYWAVREYGRAAAVRRGSAILVLGQPGQSWVIPAVRAAFEQLSEFGPVVVVASTIGDWIAFRGAGFDVQLIPDPR